MDWSRWQSIMALRDSGRIEDALREYQILLAGPTDGDEKASLLIGAHVCYCILGRTDDARQMLNQLRQCEISDLEVRLNAEFCEPCLLAEEGKPEEGVRNFAAMLQRHREVLKEDRFRYLYDDIQCRRALALVGLGRFAEATPILKEATSFTFATAVDAQQVHFNLGVCYDETKSADSAKQEFLRVINFNLKNEIEERARYRLALLCFNARAFAQAKQQLEAILENHPDSTAVVPRKHVYEQLAHTYRYLGDETNARVYMDLAQRTQMGAGPPLRHHN
jgi:tetratricopeptide (TPR) repeat protein